MDAIVKERLQGRESVLPVSEPSVKRCSKKFLALQGESAEGCIAAHNALLKELALYDFEASKAHLLRGICSEEVEQYGVLDAKIENDIEHTKGEIEQLKDQLREERVARLHKEECEALSRRVNAFPARSGTELEISRLRADLGELTALQERTSEQLQLRQKQFRLLMHAIYELQHSVGGSSLEEGQR